MQMLRPPGAPLPWSLPKHNTALPDSHEQRRAFHYTFLHKHSGRCSINGDRRALTLDKEPAVFTRNESTLDRDVRIALGGLMLFLSVFMVTGLWQIVTLALGLILFGTAAFGFCPIYRVFGISTCKVPSNRRR